MPVNYVLIYSFDEAPIIVESYLHSLFDNLANRYQVFCDGRNMSYVLEVALFAIVSCKEIRSKSSLCAAEGLCVCVFVRQIEQRERERERERERA